MSFFDEDALRELIRDEVRTTIRQELGKARGPAGEYVSVREAARIASVSPQAIRVWMRVGKLTTHSAGRVLRVRLSDLESFLAAAPRASSGEQTPETLADLRYRVRHEKRALNASHGS